MLRSRGWGPVGFAVTRAQSTGDILDPPSEPLNLQIDLVILGLDGFDKFRGQFQVLHALGGHGLAAIGPRNSQFFPNQQASHSLQPRFPG